MTSKLEALRAALKEGEDSGISEKTADDVIAELEALAVAEHRQALIEAEQSGESDKTVAEIWEQAEEQVRAALTEAEKQESLPWDSAKTYKRIKGDHGSEEG